MAVQIALPTVAVLDCLGYFGVNCGGSTFKSKFTQRATWAFGDYKLGYTWRHMAGVSVEPGSGTYQAAFSSIKSYDYVDLNASWDFTKNMRIALTVNNAFDKKPPMIGNTIATTSTNSGNTFPQWYDVVGRSYSLTLRAKF